MSLPQVYMAWNRRIAECAYGCCKAIEVKQPVVIVFFWRRGDDDHARYNIKKYYHPECWLAQGLDYLRVHPYQAAGDRGPKRTLTPEQHKRRGLILRQVGAIKQRRKNIREQDVAKRTLLLARCDAAIASKMLEIAEVGGIPKRWIEEIIGVDYPDYEFRQTKLRFPKSKPEGIEEPVSSDGQS